MTRSDGTLLLVVEPDPALRAVLADILVAEGYAVVQAECAADGLRIAREHRPDAILLDLGAAPERAFQLMEQLRATQATRYIPVVAIASGGPMAVAGRALRPAGVLPKPFDLDALLAHVASAARPRAAPVGASSR